MSRICLFVLFLGIAVRFGNCENSENNIDCTKSAPGSDKTHLGELEKIAKMFTKEHFTVDQFIMKSKNKNFGAIFPGTHWCGDGNNSKNANDLGYFKGTDACCRAHDECKYDIASGKTLDNLINNGLFTRSACYCDRQFHSCLKNVSSLLSKGIGDTYFNLLSPQCFQCTCPTNNCQIDIDDNYCSGNCTKFKWVDNEKF